MAILFDGKTWAAQKEKALKDILFAKKAAGAFFSVKSFTIVEDAGSRLYTKLKNAAADRIGILFDPVEISLADDPGMVMQQIRELSYDSRVTGIMVQKPAKAVWADVTGANPSAFAGWWNDIVACIDPAKDVDCLTPTNLDRITKESTLLPATVRACLSILAEAKKELAIADPVWSQKKVLVIGKSDIVGKPLTYILRALGYQVANVGSQDFAHIHPQTFPIIISAAGSPDLVTGDMVQEDAIVIDVGSPLPDVERASVEPKAAFLTPVPGGVGPVTVVSLMENIVSLAR